MNSERPPELPLPETTNIKPKVVTHTRRPRTTKQEHASQRNWIILRLRGALGAITSAAGARWLFKFDDATQEHLRLAAEHCRQALDGLKRGSE